MQEKIEVPIADAYSLLYQLGAIANSSSFFQTAYAIKLATEDPERLMLVTKWLYPLVAKQYNTNWRAVERNIRSVIRSVWVANPSLLRELAHHRLYSKPKPAEFIAILSAKLTADLKPRAAAPDATTTDE